jgi:hypothetical protein
MMRDLNTQVPKGRWVVIDQCRSLAPLSSFGRGRAAGVQASKCLDVQFEIHLCTTSASDLRLHIDLLPTDLFGGKSHRKNNTLCIPYHIEKWTGYFGGGVTLPALPWPSQRLRKQKKKATAHTPLRAEGSNIDENKNRYGAPEPRIVGQGRAVPIPLPRFHFNVHPSHRRSPLTHA